MARPSKPIATTEGNKVKKEKQARKILEDELKGFGEVKPYSFLTTAQRKIFKKIVGHLGDVNLLGVLDEVIINNTAIAIDRVNEIERMINEDPKLALDDKVLKIKDRWTKDVYKGIDNLGMSPVSRAKLGVLFAQKQQAQKDPLLNVVGE
jgi:P27 family predicted phage terminase small subunit